MYVKSIPGPSKGCQMDGSWGATKQGYGVANDPFQSAPFFHSGRLDLWELSRFWTSGMKHLHSFFTLFATRGNINDFFTGICMVSWRLFFSGGFFALKRPAESTGWHRCCVSTWSFSRAAKLAYICACLSNLLFWSDLAQIFSVISCNFQKPSSFWVPVKSRLDPTLLVNCILLCATELNFNLCTRAWLLHARLPSACTRVWAFFTTAWKKPVCCTSCTLSVNIPTTPDTMTAVASSMFDKKDTSMFICTSCVGPSMFVCTRRTQLHSIQDVCKL